VRGWLPSRRKTILTVAILAAVIAIGYFGFRYWRARSHFHEAEAALTANRLEEARRHLDLCLEVWPKDAKAHFLAARTARRLGDGKGWQHHLDICKALGWDARQVRLEQTLMRVQRDGPAQDESYLLSLVESHDPDTTYILEALIQGFLKNHQLAKAYACAEMWLDREPDNPQAFYWRAMAQKDSLNFKPAMDDLQRAIEVDPDYREARLRLGELLLEQERPDEAVEQYEWLYARESENSEVTMGLVHCRVAQGRLEEAKELLDPLLHEHPRSPLVLGESGKLALKLGDPTAAEDLLRRSIALDAYDPEAVFAYSQALTQRGKPGEAKVWLEKHQQIRLDLERLAELNGEIVQHPEDPKPRCEIGMILLRTGREDKGIEWLRSALQKDLNYRPAHKALADYLESKGMAREAAQHREQAGKP
jgi:tetratricopeptide (TPR) repeat protein